MLIQSVELVALPNAPAYQEKVYRARLESGDIIDLLQTHWDVPLPPLRFSPPTSAVQRFLTLG